MVKIPPDKMQRIIFLNTKVLDITHGGPCTMTCSISAHVPPNCIGVFLRNNRQSGSAGIKAYIQDSSTYINMDDLDNCPYIPIVNQSLKYGLDVGGEDHDLVIVAYVVEGTVES